jgi:hypothetical protein
MLISTFAIRFVAADIESKGDAVVRKDSLVAARMIEKLRDWLPQRARKRHVSASLCGKIWGPWPGCRWEIRVEVHFLMASAAYRRCNASSVRESASRAEDRSMANVPIKSISLIPI